MSNYFVVLDDGCKNIESTWSTANGCTLQVFTDSQNEKLLEGMAIHEIGKPHRSYNLEALPGLLDAIDCLIENYAETEDGDTYFLNPDRGWQALGLALADMRKGGAA